MSTNDPIREASEADLAEQEQELDGTGTVTDPVVAVDEANEADALEQGSEIVTDDDSYPHEAEEL